MLTDLRGLPACELGEEVGVLMRLVACPGVVGAQGVEEAVVCFVRVCWLAK